jgi:lipoprotein signal peptidase
MVANYGISFGISLPGLLVINGLLLLGLIGWWWKDRSWGLILIIIGGSLNLIDRIIYGYVRDYWQIPLTNIYNNFNDWLIFGGLLVYLWQKWQSKK